jgi:hypothetical protein
MPHSRWNILTKASAAVTVLRRKHVATIEEALMTVSKASGIDKKEIKNFRNHIHRQTYHEIVLRHYHFLTKQWRDMPKADLLQKVRHSHEFMSPDPL